MTFTANSKNITTGVGKNNQTTDQRVVIPPKYNHHSCFDILKISVLGVVVVLPAGLLCCRRRFIYPYHPGGGGSFRPFQLFHYRSQPRVVLCCVVVVLE